MSKLIIVCGLPGAGKTTLARELSKKLNIVCLHKDDIKECLYETMNLSTLEDSIFIGKHVSQLMLYLPEKYVSKGVDLMIESPFNYPEDYYVFRGWQKKYEAEIYTVICEIDNDERQRRFQERERHLAHKDLKRTFTCDDYNYQDIPGKKIRVKTDSPTDEIVKKIISELDLKR